MYEALGVKDIDILLPPPTPPQPLGPCNENIMALGGKKVSSFSKTRPSKHTWMHIYSLWVRLWYEITHKAMTALANKLHGTHTI